MAAAADALKLKVFLSYSRRDGAFVEDLLAALEACGFEAYLDRHDIAPGEEWEDRISRLIQAADTVVFVISPESICSQRCDWEIEKTEAFGKRLLPVLWRMVPVEKVPPRLQRLNYIFFTGKGRSFAKGLVDLARALNTDIDWIRDHTRLGELAARWDTRNRLEAFLIRGEDLISAKTWIGQRPKDAPEPTTLQREFITASEHAEIERVNKETAREAAGRDAEVRRVRAEQEAERLRLEAAALKAEQEKIVAENKRRNAQILAAAAVALFVLVGGGIAVYARQTVVEAQRQAESEVAAANHQRVLAELAESRLALSQIRGGARLATPIPRPAPMGEQHRGVDLPPSVPPNETDREAAARVSQDAIDMMIRFEVGNRQTYEARLSRPTWTRGSGGISIGIGYDLAFVRPEKFKADWGPYLPSEALNELGRAVGIRGVAAEALAPQLADITIPWDTALAFFKDVTVSEISQIVEKQLPNTEELSPDSYGALVSLVLNRGPAALTYAVGDPPTSIRALMEAKKFARIPAQIRAMKAQTKGQAAGLGALAARREAEAKLFEKGLVP
jgi:GH24 family phage-related lysozyme (muramidase)